jgi:pilin isopeptide linkage protein
MQTTGRSGRAHTSVQGRFLLGGGEDTTPDDRDIHQIQQARQDRKDDKPELKQTTGTEVGDMRKTGRTRIHGILVVLVLALLMSTPAGAYATPGSLTIELDQVFTTTSVGADATFTYRLVPSDPSSPMPDPSDASGHTFSVSGTTTKQVGPITYTMPGRYRYEISQVVGTPRPGYTYDRRTFTLEVFAKANGEVTLIVKDENDAKVDDIRFENGYELDGTDPALMVDPPIKKTVFGNPSYQTTFEFTLVAKDADHPMPPGSVGNTKTVRIIQHYTRTIFFGQLDYFR